MERPLYTKYIDDKTLGPTPGPRVEITVCWDFDELRWTWEKTSGQDRMPRDDRKKIHDMGDWLEKEFNRQCIAPLTSHNEVVGVLRKYGTQAAEDCLKELDLDARNLLEQETEEGEPEDDEIITAVPGYFPIEGGTWVVGVFDVTKGEEPEQRKLVAVAGWRDSEDKAKLLAEATLEDLAEMAIDQETA